ncbi:MAG: PQQ-binding-like beta-propeller repeat protein [candidate division KSB1 bacterium]|nr:PQQ-binding-like beta-propeller repeat protein [candidate division KSB1 bacterium]
MFRIGIVSLTLVLLAAACSKVRVQVDTAADDRAWLYPGGGLLHTAFRPDGPQPPLKIQRIVKLNAAPGEHLAALDSLLFIPIKNGRVAVYEARRGKLVGKLKYPVGVEGHIAIHPDGFLLMSLRLGHQTLLCYDLKQARYLWKRRAGLVWGPPIPADSSVYVVSKFKHADRYDLQTGRRIWRFGIESQAYAEPALTGSAMIFATDKGRVHAVERRTGKAVWEAQAGTRAVMVAPVVALDHGLVYIASLDSSLYALDLESGQEVWRFRAGGSFWKAPAVRDSVLIASDGMGTLYALHAATGQLLWQRAFSAPFGTTPLIVGGTVYLGALDKMFYAFELTSGRTLWQVALKGRVRTNPMVFLNSIVVGSEDRYIYFLVQEDMGVND